MFAPLEPSGRAELATRRLSDAIVLGLLHVVAGNEGAPVTGELLRDVVSLWTDDEADGGTLLYRCGDLPFAVAVGV